MSDKLKPCPFCGYKDIHKATDDKSPIEGKVFYVTFISCMYCGATVSSNNEDDAIFLWNTRTQLWRDEDE